MGASGFLGSHVVRALVAAGEKPRLAVRAGSDTCMTDDLHLEKVLTDIDDPESLRAAMAGCSTVYYCIVDTRAWLRDPAPLYRVNVDGLRNAMEAALSAGVDRFVFTSTFATIGRRTDGPSTEADAFNWWDRAPHYVRCRVQAEALFMEYCEQRGLPGVACNIGNTYGPGDHVPTPHGKMIKDVARGELPVFWDGGGPSVGIADAAQAMLLAAQKGRVGQRYIVAERWVSFEELFRLAAEAAGVEPPRCRLPLPLLYVGAGIATALAAVLRRENRMTIASIRCATLLPDVDAGLARRELGWSPRPIEASITEAINYYQEQG